MACIVTFYSYKGGVGRTMALANIAVLLAKRGLKVLAVDWDLEAPGLHRYFHEFALDSKGIEKGLIDLLISASRATEPKPDWRDYISQLRIDDITQLSLLTSGQQGQEYAARVLGFDWHSFFSEHNGGDFIESLRDEWRAAFDIVLIDSRTGITDAGGVCTIQLPDVLVLVFCANEQSLLGVKDVAARAQIARQSFPYDRMPLLVFPIPSRFDSRTEFRESQIWLEIFARELAPFYADWLPRDVSLARVLERTKVPYVAYFSFGEKLPVITQGTSDPEGLGYAYDAAATLIEKDFKEVHHLLGTSLETPSSTSVTDSEHRTVLSSSTGVAIYPATSEDRIEETFGSVQCCFRRDGATNVTADVLIHNLGDRPIRRLRVVLPGPLVELSRLDGRFGGDETSFIARLRVREMRKIAVVSHELLDLSDSSNWRYRIGHDVALEYGQRGETTVRRQGQKHGVSILGGYIKRAWRVEAPREIDEWMWLMLAANGGAIFDLAAPEGEDIERLLPNEGMWIRLRFTLPADAINAQSPLARFFSTSGEFYHRISSIDNIQMRLERRLDSFRVESVTGKANLVPHLLAAKSELAKHLSAMRSDVGVRDWRLFCYTEYGLKTESIVSKSGGSLDEGIYDLPPAAFARRFEGRIPFWISVRDLLLPKRPHPLRCVELWIGTDHERAEPGGYTIGISVRRVSGWAVWVALIISVAAVIPTIRDFIDRLADWLWHLGR